MSAGRRKSAGAVLYDFLLCAFVLLLGEGGNRFPLFAAAVCIVVYGDSAGGGLEEL